jgi:hypothetical protein
MLTLEFPRIDTRAGTTRHLTVFEERTTLRNRYGDQSRTLLEVSGLMSRIVDVVRVP